MNAKQHRPANRHPSDGPDDHDRGLSFDLSTLMQRRNLLKMFAGGAGLLTLASCGGCRSSPGASGRRRAGRRECVP